MQKAPNFVKFPAPDTINRSMGWKIQSPAKLKMGWKIQSPAKLKMGWRIQSPNQNHSEYIKSKARHAFTLVEGGTQTLATHISKVASRPFLKRIVMHKGLFDLLRHPKNRKSFRICSSDSMKAKQHMPLSDARRHKHTTFPKCQVASRFIFVEQF